VQGSNPRHPACKTGALPSELTAHEFVRRLSAVPHHSHREAADAGVATLVPQGGLEPPNQPVLKRWPLPVWLQGRIGVTGETRTPKATRSGRASYTGSEQSHGDKKLGGAIGVIGYRVWGLELPEASPYRYGVVTPVLPAGRRLMLTVLPNRTPHEWCSLGGSNSGLRPYQGRGLPLA
jgi:hypothetical protein